MKRKQPMRPNRSRAPGALAALAVVTLAGVLLAETAGGQAALAWAWATGAIHGGIVTAVAYTAAARIGRRRGSDP